MIVSRSLRMSAHDCLWKALHLACVTCGLGPGDEVLCPSETFAASVNCIRYVGATPVFCDIVGPEHINIDPNDIKKKITKKMSKELIQCAKLINKMDLQMTNMAKR